MEKVHFNVVEIKPLNVNDYESKVISECRIVMSSDAGDIFSSQSHMTHSPFLTG